MKKKIDISCKDSAIPTGGVLRVVDEGYHQVVG
jgi:hypothetical protein